jgi:hypothetical protein
MIHTSNVVSSSGLRYYEVNRAAGAQTIRLGPTGPVSCLLGGEELTGCFLQCFKD